MGIVFDIQKFCVHDGPGIRTSVFLKGCMMRCVWCHNPESFSPHIQLSYKEKDCINCGKCGEVCENSTHTFVNGIHSCDFSKCNGCGKCIDECVTDSLSLFGKNMTAQEVIDEVMKDEKYYSTSGGGVTFTGGEPTMQFDFLLELLQLSKQRNLHVCLETNGIILEERLLKILPYVDLFLLDYKATGDEIHEILTGMSQALVNNTIKVLNQHNKFINLRCPIIQGLNDTDEHFVMIKTLQIQNKNIIKAEIMAYHSFGKHKWGSIGKEYLLETLESASNELKEQWEQRILVDKEIY